jgi:hypothetical protein
MKFSSRRTILFALAASVILVFTQAFAPPEDKPAEEKPKNLKVLPKKTSMEEVKNIMRTYTKALGVRCGFCHNLQKDDQTKYDFAAEGNEHKDIARDMMKMTHKINKKYLSKIEGGKLDQITCVTCHMGRVHPIVTTDSLPAKK